MAGEVEATRLIRDHLVRIGFEPPPVPVVKGAPGFRVSADRLVAAVEKVLAARGGTDKRSPSRTIDGDTAKPSAATTWLHAGATANDDLRKDAALAARGWTRAEIAADRANREARERREGAKLGAAVGDALVAAAEHRAEMAKRAPVRPLQAIADADARLDALECAKAAGVEISPARLMEQEQLAAALGEPTPVVPWTPHAGHVAAAEAAAQVAGGDVDEQLAAIRANDHHWLEKIRERGILDEIKKVRGVRVSGPPRFRAS